MKKLLHWQENIDEEHIAVWTLDKKNSSVNSLDKKVFEELESLIDSAFRNTVLRGVIIVSGKENGFIAGADIKQFIDLSSEEEALILVQQGQHVFNKLASLAIPVVAVISGFCMGGGMELALACRYRIAEDAPHTRLGFPEVKLGLQPGWGGTVRLPKLIGVIRAMPLILTGKSIDAKTALKIRMIDDAVSKENLLSRAKALILNPPKISAVQSIFLWKEKMINLPWMRKLIAYVWRKKLMTQINPMHYPAPYIIINLWKKEGCHTEQAMTNEAHSLAQLLVSQTSRNLVRAFFLQERLKKYSKQISFEFTPDKLALCEKNSPGFIINRILVQYFREALMLLKEGIPADTIDAAMKDFGMSFGPFEFIDMMGLDNCLSIVKQAGIVSQEFNIISQKVESGKLGCKTNEGFYRYINNIALAKPYRNISTQLSSSIVKKLVQVMLKEAEECVKEKLIEDKDLFDAAMIFWAGFPAFRGGLLYRELITN